jgi:hypothetical protein
MDRGISARDVVRTSLFVYQPPQSVTLQEMTFTDGGFAATRGNALLMMRRVEEAVC